MSSCSEPSQSKANVFICLATGAMTITFGICYGMWIGHGCRAFLPFISDLGLHGAMANVFLGGLLVTAVFMFCALPHIVDARRCLLSSLQVHSHWQTINSVVGLAGAAAAFGVGLLGFFPWDRVLFWHLLCADMIFGGGLVWAIGSWVLARRFASASCNSVANHTWDSCRRRRRFQLPVAVACMCVLFFASVCFVGAFFSDPSIFTKDGLAKTLQLANSDFDGYCTGLVGWHGLAWINLAALAEWIYVALLVVGVVLAAADLQANIVVQRNLHALLPMLSADEGREWWHFW